LNQALKFINRGMKLPVPKKDFSIDEMSSEYE